MKCTAINNDVACLAEDINPGDNYCWMCGTPVVKELRVPSQAVPSLQQPPFTGCVECSKTAIDSRGFCRNCGVMARPPLRSDFFISLDPHLAVRCHTGREHKNRNDDYGLVATRIVRGENARWLIVADGLSKSMNPHLASEAAAQAASRMIELMIADGNFEAQSVISQAIFAAQKAVLTVPEDAANPLDENEKPLKRAMTTIVMALTYGGRCYLGWVGDSRLYAIYSRNGKCGAKRLTTDDTKLEKLRGEGMSFKEASRAPGAASMTQCLGPLSDKETLLPHFAELPLAYVAAVVGVTDGSYSYFDLGPDPETDKDRPSVELAQAFVKANGDALTFTNRLIDMANERGGSDNITAAAMFFSDLQPIST